MQPGHQVQKHAFIDALRGYAVLLVITSHAGGAFPGLPYPLKKLTNFGWHGVQLFFLLSCVTLLLSWHADKAKGGVSRLAFWLRRVFRIAPAYYCGAALYAALLPPEGFDLRQLLSFALFVNAWHPATTPTTAGAWAVVPGGWSVGVEFTFYMLFPLVAAAIRSLRAALVFVVASIAFGCVANTVAAGPLLDAYGEAATSNFLYFWFPNQLPVFALGTVLFFLMQRLWRPGNTLAAVLRRHGTPVACLCAGLCVVVAELPFSHHLPALLPWPPRMLAASLVFMAVILALSVCPGSPFVNRAVSSYGQVSFSAYILHFLVLYELPRAFPAVFDTAAEGWRAIPVFFLFWIVAAAVTYVLALAAFRMVEAPMIGLGRRVIARIPKLLPA